MGDQTPAASQENTSSSRALIDGPNPLSSPVLPVLPQGSKPKKAPTITPRSFTRFFTPKSSLKRGERIGASRQALRDITASAANRKRRRTPTEDPIQLFSDKNACTTKKRRTRIPDSPDTTPDRSSPLKRIRNQSLEIAEGDGSDTGTILSDHQYEVFSRGHGLGKRKTVAPIVSSRYRDSLGREFQRELGGGVRKLGSSNHSGVASGSKDWQHETTNFFSRPEDAYACMNVATPADHSIPFCTASCNTNALVAIGDEDGGVRLLESGKNENPGFSKTYLTFRPHTNAILDLAFSPDDLLLATASGDQTSQVIDMPTQRAIYTLAGHVSSVKQACFQPGSSSVIATSSRDGSVQIWDLRCKGHDAPAQDIRVSLEPGNTRMIWARSINTISEAHASRQRALSTPATGHKAAPILDASSKTESPGRRGDVSITALAFLNPGREHLLLTGSEANASVKLWDLRTTHNHRTKRATPLSSTRQPESHNKYRQFGLTSISLSGDGARLYTLCRDNTVYAYSTSHLILGHAPELSTSSSKPRRSGGLEKEGSGPLYGFRHPKFHATTFYVKCAIRPAKDDRTELLALGSSDSCAVVFPTDERYMQRPPHPTTCPSDSQFPRLRPSVSRTDSGTGLAARLNDTIPIYQHGSSLVRGHGREVTGLTWTPRGELVTVGDDSTVRCWREGDDARNLRIGGEKDGRRWGCGWAEAEDGWDDDDG